MPMNNQVRKDLVHVIAKAVTEALENASEPLNKIVRHTLVKRPVAGGRCAAVWDQLDRMVEAGQEPTLKEIQKYGAKHRWNANNTRVEFYRWRSAVSKSAGKPTRH